MPDIRRGLIIVNTGPGKGKTTAAMGTALRAVGNGMKVLMLQFLKGSWHYGELDAVKAFGDNFVMKQMGRGFVKVGGAETDPEDVRLVEEAWAEAEKAILSGKSTTPSLTKCSIPKRSWQRSNRSPKWCTSSSPDATPIPALSRSPTRSPR
jgi:cob(I)alamin adenosyltransferase